MNVEQHAIFVERSIHISGLAKLLCNLMQEINLDNEQTITDISFAYGALADAALSLSNAIE